MLRYSLLILGLAAPVCAPCLGHARAGLRCVPSAVDLGEVRGGAPRQQRIVLVNDDDAPIEIIGVERGCGCMDAQLDRRILAAGTRAALTISVRTAGQPNGPRSWNLRVRYRQGEAVREELIVVAATIRNEVTVEPSILALEVQDRLHQQIVVTDVRSPPLQVTSVKASHAALRATAQLRAGGVTRIDLDIAAADLAEGRHDAVVSIYTDDPLYSPLQIPVTLTRRSKTAVAVNPPAVEAQVSSQQPIASALVRLRGANGQRVTIAAAETGDPGITCTWAAGPGAGATLKVRVDSRRLVATAGPRAVRVRLAEPAGETVTIPVTIGPK